jgi:hypothetical protein
MPSNIIKNCWRHTGTMPSTPAFNLALQNTEELVAEPAVNYTVEEFLAEQREIEREDFLHDVYVGFDVPDPALEEEEDESSDDDQD